MLVVSGEITVLRVVSLLGPSLGTSALQERVSMTACSLSRRTHESHHQLRPSRWAPLYL